VVFESFNQQNGDLIHGLLVIRMKVGDAHLRTLYVSTESAEITEDLSSIRFSGQCFTRERVLCE